MAPALLGLGPGLAFFAAVLGPKSFVVLLSLFSAFLWLLVMLLSSALLRPWAPLRGGAAGPYAGALLACAVFLMLLESSSLVAAEWGGGEDGENQVTWREHLESTLKEREVYWANKRESREDPTRTLCLTIDGADQGDFHLPSWWEQDKRACKMYKLKTHVTGCLVAGRQPWCFVSGDACKNGHNLTIQVLYDVLVGIKKDEGVLPDHINIQLDNTTRQNKGKYFFAFCQYLVHK